MLQIKIAMKTCLHFVIVTIAVCLISVLMDRSMVQSQSYDPDSHATVGEIPTPEGFVRVDAEPGSFAEYLRTLPLRDEKELIYLYNGQPSKTQHFNYRVVDLDIGGEDLQQCADAAIRLRCDYLYFVGRYDEIEFRFTSGHNAPFRKWIAGYRPVVKGPRVTWEHTASRDSSLSQYRDYLRTLFTYCGSYSLERDLERIDDLADLKIGDLFIQGGFPGHVCIVVDMARDSASGEVAFIVAQGFTPAQDIHIIRNDTDMNPWYIAGKGERFVTPAWTFDWNEIHRFE